METEIVDYATCDKILMDVFVVIGTKKNSNCTSTNLT